MFLSSSLFFFGGGDFPCVISSVCPPPSLEELLDLPLIYDCKLKLLLSDYHYATVSPDLSHSGSHVFCTPAGQHLPIMLTNREKSIRNIQKPQYSGTIKKKCIKTNIENIKCTNVIRIIVSNYTVI